MILSIDFDFVAVLNYLSVSSELPHFAPQIRLHARAVVYKNNPKNQTAIWAQECSGISTENKCNLPSSFEIGVNTMIFCIKNGKLCIKNEELCIKNEELCVHLK